MKISTEVTLFLLLLLLSICIRLVSEQEDDGPYNPVTTSDQDLPVASYVYTFDDTTSQDICLVLVPSRFMNDAVVQPDITIPHLGGQFFTSPDLDSALFRVSHIRRNCRQVAASSSQTCDQLLIRRVRTLGFGNFSFQYLPQGRSQAIQLNVLYGPEGLTYIGDRRPNTLIQLDIEDTLTFELRVDRIVGSFDFTVCESLDNAAFRPSMLLVVDRTAQSVETCIQAFGSYSRPYRVEVNFNLSVADPSVLTQRKIRTVLGSSCNTTGTASETLNVVGISIGNSITPDSSVTPTPTISAPTVTTSPTVSMTPKPIPVDVIVGSLFAALVVLAMIIAVVVTIPLVWRYYNRCSGNDGNYGNNSNVQLADGLAMNGISNTVSTISITKQSDAEGTASPVPNTVVSPASSRRQDVEETDIIDIDLAEKSTVVISFSQDSLWNSQFKEKLKSEHGTSLLIIDGQDEEFVKETLCNQKLTMLFLVADEQGPIPNHANSCPCMQLLQDIESTPTSTHYEIVVITSADQEKWGSSIKLLQRGTAIETAESVHRMQATSAGITSSSADRADHLQNRKNNIKTTEVQGKRKSKQKKSWPFRKSVPKLDERRQHSSLENFRDPMLTDIHSKVCGMEKSLEYMQDQQDAAALAHEHR